MAGTNDFALFAVEAYVPGGGISRIRPGRKNLRNAFRPVPVPKSTFVCIVSLFPGPESSLPWPLEVDNEAAKGRTIV